jgi:hypothetical protein
MFATWMSFSLFVLGCLTGENAVMFYSNTIIKKMGSFDPVIGSMIMSGANFIGNFTAIYFVNAWRRRTVLLSGFIT